MIAKLQYNLAKAGADGKPLRLGKNGTQKKQPLLGGAYLGPPPGGKQGMLFPQKRVKDRYGSEKKQDMQYTITAP